jgi:dTDP-4-amino-4,6-dideoxygalactose transaminase
MLNTKFSSWPLFSEQEAEAVKQVVLSNKVNYWTGSKCREFEQAFAEWTGVKHALAVANGTLALELAMHGLGIGIGDEVIVPPRTFMATASSVVAVGATPIFADVDLNSQALSAETIAPMITDKTKAIIVVHLGGMPADMDGIMALAAQHNLYVIEDCAQAHGAKYKDRSVGTIGHIGAWSFCQDKIMTTGGEGGMVTTNDQTLWKKMWAYKDHGKSYDAVYNKKHPPGFRWLHETFGSNYRMTEMQAAIGLIQLQRMTDWTAKRQHNAKLIDAAAANFKLVRRINIPNFIEYAAYKHYLFVNQQFLKQGWSRDRIVDEINALGVPCYQGSCSEIYLEKAFVKHSSLPKQRLPNAKQLGEASLMFFVHPTLTEQEMKKTCAAIEQVLAQAEVSVQVVS